MHADTNWVHRLKEKGRNIKEAMTENKELVAIVAVGAIVTGAVIAVKPEEKVYETELREIDMKLRTILDREPELYGGEDAMFAGDEYGIRV